MRYRIIDKNASNTKEKVFLENTKSLHKKLLRKIYFIRYMCK